MKGQLRTMTDGYVGDTDYLPDLANDGRDKHSIEETTTILKKNGYHKIPNTNEWTDNTLTLRMYLLQKGLDDYCNNDHLYICHCNIYSAWTLSLRFRCKKEEM